MALRPVHTDTFDDLLLEAFEAEQAGVFGRTPVDVGKLMSKPVRRFALRPHRYILAGLPVAAAVALFLGLAAFWKAGTGAGGTVSNSNGGAGAAERYQMFENLRGCVTGPGVLARSDCRSVDFDADGDVDLRDMGMFQLGDPGS